MVGNIYVSRTQRFTGVPPQRSEGQGVSKRLLLSYLIQPHSCVYFLRTLAPFEVQQAAPMVPVYSFCVYSLFFLVPLTLRAPPRRKFRDR